MPTFGWTHGDSGATDLSLKSTLGEMGGPSGETV